MKKGTKLASREKPARQVFISWAKSLSGDIADRFHLWLENYFPDIKAFVSKADIELGTDWHNELAKVLPKCDVIVAFLTKENIGASEWMMYEIGAVSAGRRIDERVVMILVDLEIDNIPPNSPYVFRHSVQISDEEGMRHLVTMLHKRCAKHNRTTTDASIKARFKASWPEFIEAAKDAIATKPHTRCITSSFPNDKKFSEWAAAYHDIVHCARDLAVRIMDEAKPMSENQVALKLNKITKNEKEEEEKKVGSANYNPPWKTPYVSEALDRFLNLIDDVFGRIVVPGTPVWSCLRNLRADGYYHTLIRSRRHPSKWSDKSLPWGDKEGTVLALTHTINTDERCVIIPEPDSAAFPAQHPDLPKESKPASMMLGAVLTKQVRDRNRPINVDLWWIICLSSSKKGAFTEAHKPVLQACNDVLSTVANAILRLNKDKSA